MSDKSSTYPRWGSGKRLTISWIGVDFFGATKNIILKKRSGRSVRSFRLFSFYFTIVRFFSFLFYEVVYNNLNRTSLG